MPKRFEKLRRLLRPAGALAGLAGAALVVNRGLREASAIPHDHIGGTRRRWTWRGHEIFATELGSGPPVVLVHGVYAGASSFEYRKLAPLLAARHRVIAFDLLGCGLSEMPDVVYTADLFVEQILAALAEFAGEEPTLVGSSLGAALSIRAAARVGPRVARLVAIAPTGLRGVLDDAPNLRRRATAVVLRSPVVGESVWNAFASKPAVRWFLANDGYADAGSITPDVVAQYQAVTHQPGARFVPAALAGGALDCNVASDLPFVDSPVLVLWGNRASPRNPVRNADAFVRLAKSAQLQTFPNSALLPHEEEPEAAAEAIASFVSAAGAVAG